ncbi:hypothetical protein EYF80_047492 [Liparis tanakae]|uniref:Uncharacterized protein n=1 Tax=Liparis tanakae TaxID=230148 RepID=A0A4Z2FMV0_9TELE|nr:hypothetical protein EYF80_047492 [Liparis tanakae]
MELPSEDRGGEEPEDELIGHTSLVRKSSSPKRRGGAQCPTVGYEQELQCNQINSTNSNVEGNMGFMCKRTS